MRHNRTPLGWLAEELPMFWTSPDIDDNAGLPDDETDIMPDLDAWLAAQDNRSAP